MVVVEVAVRAYVTVIANTAHYRKEYQVHGSSMRAGAMSVAAAVLGIGVVALERATEELTRPPRNADARQAWIDSATDLLTDLAVL
jgi:hypothetical protein